VTFDPYGIITAAALAKFGSEIGTDVVKRLYGPLIDHYGEKFRERALRRITPVLAEADRLLAEGEKRITDVPDRLLIPILQKVSVNDSDALTHKWASLLAASAKAPENISTSFVNILGELSPTDVRLLDCSFDRFQKEDSGLFPWVLGEELGIENPRRQASIDNIARLGLWRQIGTSVWAGEVGEAIRRREQEGGRDEEIFLNEDTDQYQFTTLGKLFVRACRNA
jgi:hypothetical protein